MNRIVIEGQLSPARIEDSGRALVAFLEEEAGVGRDAAFEIRLQSWSDSTPPVHSTMEALQGKRLRITVEEIT